MHSHATQEKPSIEEMDVEGSFECKTGIAESPVILPVDESRVKRIKRKVDARLSAILALMYVVNQIDRANLPNAAIAGMTKELNLVGYRYSLIVMMFFPFYILFNPVATVCARKLGPRHFLAGITLAWGLVVIGFGLVNDWKSQVGLRAVLGILEAGFFPSAVFLVSMWYLRREVAKRIAFFYLVGNTCGGFSGVLAYGLQQMDGVDGKGGWRWIFIWEGILTVIIAFAGWVLLVDFPEDAKKSWKFLSDEDLELMIDRVERDREDAHVTKFHLGQYLAQAKDWKIWFFAANFGLSAVVTYSVAYFMPIILMNDLGFTVVMSQCLTAPCYAFSGVLGVTEAFVSDKFQIRGHILVFNSLLAITGVAVLGYAHQPYVRYFGAFLITGGSNGNVPASLTYQANNVVGQWKRAFTSATIVAMGGIGGIIGSLVFRDQDAPTYHPGLYTCFTAACLTILSVGVTSAYMWRQNKRQRENGLVLEGVHGFRYIL